MRLLLISLSLLVPVSPAAPAYGCRCDTMCASTVLSMGEAGSMGDSGRGTRHDDTCPCCEPKRPERRDGDSPAVCRYRTAVAQQSETPRVDLPAPAHVRWTLEAFAEASRDLPDTTAAVDTAPPRVFTPLRV